MPECRSGEVPCVGQRDTSAGMVEVGRRGAWGGGERGAAGSATFIATFGDFILAKIVLTSEDNWTLAVGMYQWVSNQLTSRWGLFAAGAVIAAIPVLALFLSLQRYIVGGLTAGAVKG